MDHCLNSKHLLQTEGESNTNILTPRAAVTVKETVRNPGLPKRMDATHALSAEGGSELLERTSDMA